VIGEAGGAPVVVKDPRIGVLLPLWDDLLRSTLHPVLVVRDPFRASWALRL
jgi:hypothetical protein